MARKGSVWNRLLNVVGLVDVDEEPQRSSTNSYEEDRYGYGGQQGYTPSARRNDRPQSSQRSLSSYSGGSQYNRSSSSSRSSRSAQDSYSEWNTAPRSQNRYANSIYDDDTTVRGGMEGREDNAYVSSNYRSSGYRSVDDGYRSSGSYRASDDGYRSGDGYRSSAARRRSYDEYDTMRDDRYDDEFGYSGQRSARRSPRIEEDGTTERSAALPARTSRSRSGEVVVFDIRVLEDCREVIYALLANKTVVFTVEEMDNVLIRRVVDTLSGAACALDATIRKTSEVSYLLAPRSIEVNGTRRSVERRY
ncbi:MAG: cell division protein SepF [Clostridia bacterium]|nr:cell division protein SepF [Clostridia bacterium]